jgi:hypothetical protein
MVNEYLESYLQSLKTAEVYGREYWLFLVGEGPAPDPRKHALSDEDAQAGRLKLAALK